MWIMPNNEDKLRKLNVVGRNWSNKNESNWQQERKIVLFIVLCDVDER